MASAAAGAAVVSVSALDSAACVFAAGAAVVLPVSAAGFEPQAVIEASKVAHKSVDKIFFFISTSRICRTISVEPYWFKRSYPFFKKYIS